MLTLVCMWPCDLVSACSCTALYGNIMLSEWLSQLVLTNRMTHQNIVCDCVTSWATVTWARWRPPLLCAFCHDIIQCYPFHRNIPVHDYYLPTHCRTSTRCVTWWCWYTRGGSSWCTYGGQTSPAIMSCWLNCKSSPCQNIDLLKIDIEMRAPLPCAVLYDLESLKSKTHKLINSLLWDCWLVAAIWCPHELLIGLLRVQMLVPAIWIACCVATSCSTAAAGLRWASFFVEVMGQCFHSPKL